MLPRVPCKPPPRGHILYALGNVIRQNRVRVGLRLNEMAMVIGVAMRTMQDYEAGLREPPIETLVRIARACDLPLSIFVSPLDDHQVPLREVRRVQTRH